MDDQENRIPDRMRTFRPPLPPIKPAAVVPLLLAVLLAFIPVWIWFWWRIEPGSGEIAVLIKKTGDDLPSGQILSQTPVQKGIQLDVLPEGRYFKNPYTWGWEIHDIIDIPAGKLGVRTRLFGQDLPPGKIIATDESKGILRDVLRPGKYRVNPYGYRVEIFNAINIRPGHVGVTTSLTGRDILHDALDDHEHNAYLVKEDLKGVKPEVLDPGTYYVNPYIVNIVEVNLQSQRFEMSGQDVISFLTEDGFTVTVEGTIEFGLERDMSALLSHKVGDMDDITKKLILPRARGFSRIEGSKHPAIDFIVGETRQKFQNELETHLRSKCDDWGVDIKSVLVRKIIVPDEIASINRDREIAVQDAKKYEQEIAQAQSKAELVKQEMLAQQNKEKVQADTAKIRAVINAEQDSAVRIVSAEKDLEVAKVDYAAALHRAEAIVLKAKGKEDGIQAKNLAEAKVLEQRVQALGSGINLARYELYGKVAPQIKSIISSDSKEGLGTVFTPLLPAGKGGAQ